MTKKDKTIVPPPEGNPDYRLIQEQYADDPWKVLVCAILVRRARGSYAKAIAEEFFRRWGDPDVFMASADPDEVFALLKPLGFGNIRTRAIAKLSDAYLSLSDPFDLVEVSGLPEVGNYALESFTIFVLGVTDFRPEDLMLQYYLRREGKLLE